MTGQRIRAARRWGAAVVAAIAIVGPVPASAQVGELPSMAYTIGLRDGRLMTGTVSRIDNAGVVLHTTHGAIIVPWERMDPRTREMFADYIPGSATDTDPVITPGMTPIPEPPPSSDAGRPDEDESATARVFGIRRKHWLLWLAAWGLVCLVATVVSAVLARRRRRPVWLWTLVSIALPTAYASALTMLPEKAGLVLLPAALAIPVIIPLLLALLPRVGPSAAELAAARAAAAEPPKPKTIALPGHHDDDKLTELDRRTWDRDRALFDRRFFERHIIPWLRGIQQDEAMPRPRITVRASGHSIRARRIMQADEVGVLLAFEETGDPLAGGERYPYAEIEEITIARGEPAAATNSAGNDGG